MPFNGSGTFTRIANWVLNAAQNINILPDLMDNDTNDIANGLSQCITKDGQQTVTANIPFNGFKLTGVGNGTSANDAVNYGQVITSGTFQTPNLVSPAMTGIPTAPTAAVGTNTTQVATMAALINQAFQAQLPLQTGNNGKIIQTNGATVSWTDTFTIAMNEAKGANIASAATINLTTATGNFVHVTGTTTITAITIPVGAERTVVFDGILTLTNGAALLLPGAANIVTAAGDRMVVRGDTAGAIVVDYVRASGRAVVATPYGLSVPLAVLTPAGAANADALNVFSSGYDNYLILVEGILPNVTDTLVMRFAVGGIVDSTNGNYYGTLTNGFALASGVGILAGGNGASGPVHALNINSTSTMKTIHTSFISQRDATPTYDIVNNAQAFLRAAAVSGVRFSWSSGNNFSAGTIRIYGYNNT